MEKLSSTVEAAVGRVQHLISKEAVDYTLYEAAADAVQSEVMQHERTQMN